MHTHPCRKLFVSFFPLEIPGIFLGMLKLGILRNSCPNYRENSHLNSREFISLFHKGKERNAIFFISYHLFIFAWVSSKIFLGMLKLGILRNTVEIHTSILENYFLGIHKFNSQFLIFFAWVSYKIFHRPIFRPNVVPPKNKINK